MAVQPIPAGFHTVTPYQVVRGAKRLVDFLKRAFQAEEIFVHTTPDGGVGHAQLRIGDSMIMLGEAMEPYQPLSMSLYLYVPDTDAVYHQAIQAGGKSLMEPADMFYGDRNGGVQDPWGNQWWIATHIRDVSPKELQRAADERFAEQETRA